MADEELVFPLKCAVLNYAWGKVGSSSEVADLAKCADPEFQVNEDAPYSELWMGTHPNGPSKAVIAGKEMALEEWVKGHPDKLGPKVKEYFKGSLPYLFKVLSVNTSLSIQAHPNKILAEKLHKERPDLYPDRNHKPEMAIALTPFQGLCGFRTIKDVAMYMQHIEELRTVVGINNALKLITASKCMDMPMHREAMKNCFSFMMQRDKETVEAELNKLIKRVRAMAEEGENTSLYVWDVLSKLSEEFPGDVGCFAIYFLNVINLEPGEAMFLEANLPHAYLSGDCMECMACSDNVVRAGLTLKYRDVHTLVEMLDYTGRVPSKTKFQGIKVTENGCNITMFRPHIPDFSVTMFEIPSNDITCCIRAIDSASILIIIQGEGQLTSRTLKEPLGIERGSVLFIAADEAAEVEVESEGMLMFRAQAGNV
ncbi:hypothetical protein ACJMK2_018085 [Sinanodonta woodiana]|uniref:mannose-6-phosphate isomerase n=1 Tax=Sinanodonta woodiana TaxID=1069815 RepID=A0ABD3UEE1_SINWO